MFHLVDETLSQLLSDHEPPCISLYQPTHRRRDEQDPIRFKNLVKQIETSLRDLVTSREARPLLEQFSTWVDDGDFWNRQLDGLAMFCSPNLFRMVRLQLEVPELAVVDDSFYTKPLIRVIQSADRYQVLSLTQSSVSLHEGTRFQLDKVALHPDVPGNLSEAVGEPSERPHLTVTSRSGPRGAHSRHGDPASYHGHGGQKDKAEADLENYFRAVDRAIWKHHSRPAGLPLMLAALKEYHPVFQRVSRNQHLLPSGIEHNPESLDGHRLREQAWGLIEPHYEGQMAELADAFRAARAREQGSDDISDVARALVAGRVETLLVEARRHVAGRMDPETGSVAFGGQTGPGVSDILDDLAEAAIRTGAKVLVVPADKMPTASGVAATYRF